MRRLLHDRRRELLLSLLGLLLVSLVVTFEARRTAPVRASMRSLSSLIAAANQGDRTAASRLCTSRFLRESDLTPAPEGGLSGLPRSIDRRFRTWKRGDSVLICPTGREGAVFRFVLEDGIWRYDGLAGFSDHQGLLEPASPSKQAY